MSPKKRRVLITGKNGQLAHELARAFGAETHNAEVIAHDRTTLDLGKPDQIREQVRDIKPDLIINAAAYTAVDRAESEPHIAMLVNGVAPGILAEEANRLGVPLIHYSTDYVFAGDAQRPYREDDAVAPQSSYGRSKLEGERAVAAVAKRFLVLRASWLYSATHPCFVQTMLRLARERDVLRVVSDQRGVPTWVRTVAEVTSKAVAVKGSGFDLKPECGIYHVAAAGETTWHGFASAIMAHTHDAQRRIRGVEAISTAQFPTPAKRPAYSVLNHGAIRAALGFTFNDWETDLRQCLQEIPLPSA